MITCVLCDDPAVCRVTAILLRKRQGKIPSQRHITLGPMCEVHGRSNMAGNTAWEFAVKQCRLGEEVGSVSGGNVLDIS